MIRGNTSDFIGHPLPKNSIFAHGASHHAWAPGPHHLNPALTEPVKHIGTLTEGHIVLILLLQMQTRRQLASTTKRQI